jgi:hypothetical protein
VAKAWHHCNGEDITGTLFVVLNDVDPSTLVLIVVDEVSNGCIAGEDSNWARSTNLFLARTQSKSLLSMNGKFKLQGGTAGLITAG